MSDDQIRLVQSLIDSGEDDVDRLRHILETLQRGNPLDESDQNYLQDLAKKPDPDLMTFAPTSEASSPNMKSEEAISPYSIDNHSPERKKTFSKSPFKKKIVLVAAIISIVVTYVGLDIYAVTALQFRPHHGNQYIISPTQLFIQAEVCNPSYFPASFNKYEIKAFYQSESIEKAEISGSTISPKTYVILDGEFDLNQDVVTKLQKQSVQFDPTQAHITTVVDAPIFGVIPFSVVKEYGTADFQQVLKNGTRGSFSCA